jgi:hypothetical protein
MNKGNNIEQGLTWLDKALNIIERYKIKTILKAFGLILMIALLIAFIKNPTYIIDKWQEVQEREHTERMEITLKNSQIINTEVENLRYRTGADRVILLQFHNSKQSLSGLPFIYLTATAEALDYNVIPVAEQYEAVKTSIYPFMTYITREGYFCGDIEELRTLDKALAYRMQGNDVHHLAFQYIEGEHPLGLLVCTFTKDVDETHNCAEIEHQIRKTSNKIAVLLSNNE